MQKIADRKITRQKNTEVQIVAATIRGSTTILDSFHCSVAIFLSDNLSVMHVCETRTLFVGRFLCHREQAGDNCRNCRHGAHSQAAGVVAAGERIELEIAEDRRQQPKHTARGHCCVF